ncbi:MAG: glycosidase [Bacteroidota bacterium]
MSDFFESRKLQVYDDYKNLLKRRNKKSAVGNGIFNRYRYPVLTTKHVPPHWVYDLNPETNPFFMMRMGVNAVFNTGAIVRDGKVVLVTRVEGYDQKSFFAIATSENGIDYFRFDDFPLAIPPLKGIEEFNYADMRLTTHQDGWIYGTFDAEVKDISRPNDLAATLVKCAIIRTKDFKTWERLPNLQMPDNTPCDCILHPELVNGQYAFYIQSQVRSITRDSAPGIRLAFVRSIENPVVEDIKPINRRKFFTVNQSGTGPGAPPIKTDKGWIHLAYGLKKNDDANQAVLYTFMTDLNNPLKVIYEPGGFLIAPEGDELKGGEENQVLSNGWIAREDGSVYIYYSSSNTDVHVALTSIDQLLDFCMNTPPDGRDTQTIIQQRIDMIKNNEQFLSSHLRD